MTSIIDFQAWRAARAAKKAQKEARKRGIPDEISKNFQQKRPSWKGPVTRADRSGYDSYGQKVEYESYEDLFADIMDGLNARGDGPFGMIIGIINDDVSSIDYLKFNVTDKEVRHICKEIAAIEDAPRIEADDDWSA